MKKMLFIVMMVVGLVVCIMLLVLKEDIKLKDVYSVCINMVEGNLDKIEVCQSVLNVLKKDKQYQQFVNQESVCVLDY